MKKHPTLDGSIKPSMLFNNLASFMNKKVTNLKKTEYLSQNERLKRFAVSNDTREGIRAMELKPQAIREISEISDQIIKFYMSHLIAKRKQLDQIVLDFIEDTTSTIYFT